MPIEGKAPAVESISYAQAVPTVDFKERRVADRLPKELRPHCEKHEDFGHHLRRAAKRALFYDDSLGIGPALKTCELL